MTDYELVYLYFQKGALQTRRDQLEAFRKKYKPNTSQDQHYWDYAYHTVDSQSKDETARQDMQMAKNWWISLSEPQRLQMERLLRGGTETKIVKTQVRTSGWQAQVGGWVVVISIVLVVYFVYLKRPGRWL
jgi:hypothetical protein